MFNVKKPTVQNKSFERKLYTGEVSLFVLPGANADNATLEELEFYTRDEEPSYNWGKGDRLELYLETIDAPIYDLAGEEVDKLNLKHKENFFVSHDKAWPKSTDKGEFTSILFNDGTIRWCKVKSEGTGKDKRYILNDPKAKADEGTYRMFTHFTQTRLLEFFYIAIGWHSHNIGIKKANKDVVSANKKIELNNKRKNAEVKPLLEALPFGYEYTDEAGETVFQSTDPTQIFDILFPLDLEKVRSLVNSIAEAKSGVCGTLGINFNNGKAYQTLFSSLSDSYTSIGNVTTPEYETKYAKGVKGSIVGYAPKNAFFNTENMFLMEWDGDSNESAVTPKDDDTDVDGLSDLGTGVDLDDTLLGGSIDDIL